MIEILPSILASNLLNMGEDVERMLESGVDALHVDIMDVHLMLSQPERYLKVFADAGAGAITVHAEAEGDTAAMLQKIRALGCKAGISVKPGTGAQAILPLLPLCDLVLVMTVEPGFGGQKFMADMMPKIRALRDAGYRGQIMVDGGVNAQTARTAVEAGADALVMGTALLRAADPAQLVRVCHALEGSK